MGRLYWKFFFFIWLAQLSTVAGVTAYFWWEHHARPAHEAPHLPPLQEAARSSAPSASTLPEGPPPQGQRPPLHRPDRGPRLPLPPLVGGLLASLLFAALLARYFSRPIRVLRAAMETSATGDLNARAGASMGKRQDELAELGHAFDRMAAKIAVLLDAQRRLLHDVSHELRSPLARLQASIGLMRQDPKAVAASLERIESESMRMERMIGELLTLSRLEAGATGRDPEVVPVNELLAALVHEADLEAGTRLVTLQLELGADRHVLGDPELLHRALDNVIRNAIKFSPQGGTVQVRAEPTSVEDGINLLVMDSGPGVPDAELEAIFYPFYRGQRPANADGHGLGLAIARRVIEGMNGRIVGANREGGGFAVKVWLPAHHDDGRQSAAT